MLYPLGKLLENAAEPVYIQEDKKVSDALNLMIANDYSQLPVVDSNGLLTGIISEQSISHTYYHQRAAVSLLDLTVDHCKTKAVTMTAEDDLFDALDRLATTAAIVIVKDRKPYRILTDFDTTYFFRDAAEGLILVEDMEVSLRQYIDSAFPGEHDRDSALIKIVGADASDPTKPRRAYDKLSLGQYIRVIEHDQNWPKFQGKLEPLRMFSELMDQVREIRNQLAHFRDRLDPVQRAMLIQARMWLDARPRLQSAASAVQQTIHPVASDLAVSTPAEKYAPLKSFLGRHIHEGPVIQVSFEDIEAVLGESLPDSATSHRSWWSNDPANHVQAHAWLEAGWLIEAADLINRLVTFRRSNAALYPLFFTDLVKRLKNQRPGITRAAAVGTDNWWSFSAGRSGFTLGWVITRQQTLRVELYIDMGHQMRNKSAFDCLYDDRDRFEDALGYKLVWERLDDRRASRVYTARPIKLDSPVEVEDAKQWAVATMVKFSEIFPDYIRDIEFAPEP